MNKKVSRIIALVVVLCMIFTTVAFADPGKKGFEKNSKKVELKDEEYNKALMSLIEKEIVKGYGKGDYGLSGNVKRGDVIVMIIRALGLEGLDAKDLGEKYLNLMTDDKADFEDEFEDVEREAYYYGPIKIARELGIAKGDGRYFKPNKPVTIQEAIWLIERADLILDKNNLFDKTEVKRIEELKNYFNDELNQFAKRRDVIYMLNYIIEGYDLDDEKDSKDEEKLTVEITLAEGKDVVFFTADKFIEAFDTYAKNNKLDEGLDLEYIEFNKDYNNPMYNDGDDENIEKGKEYYVNDHDYLIKYIKYERKDNFSKKVEIPFNAYDDEGNSPYKGTIIITVIKKASFKDVVYNMLEGETLQFNSKDFDESIETIRFVLPDDEKEGSLSYGKYIKDRDEITDAEKEYSNINRIFFTPVKGFNRETLEIEYTAKTDKNSEVKGSIVINVLAVKLIGEIEEVEMDKDDIVTIKFADKLDSKLPSGVDLEDIDFVRFSEPNEGTLWISKARVDSNKEYNDMSKLNEIVYRSTDVEPDDIIFYAVDISELIIYTGTIDIELEEDK